VVLREVILLILTALASQFFSAFFIHIFKESSLWVYLVRTANPPTQTPKTSLKKQAASWVHWLVQQAASQLLEAA
jgi:hypothetical protein